MFVDDTPSPKVSLLKLVGVLVLAVNEVGIFHLKGIAPREVPKTRTLYMIVYGKIDRSSIRHKVVKNFCSFPREPSPRIFLCEACVDVLVNLVQLPNCIDLMALVAEKFSDIL